MNRSEATFLAHLDAIEDRIMQGFADIRERLDRIHEDIGGVKIDLATHRHEEDQS